MSCHQIRMQNMCINKHTMRKPPRSRESQHHEPDSTQLTPPPQAGDQSIQIQGQQPKKNGGNGTLPLTQVSSPVSVVVSFLSSSSPPAQIRLNTSTAIRPSPSPGSTHLHHSHNPHAGARPWEEVPGSCSPTSWDSGARQTHTRCRCPTGLGPAWR